MVCLTGIFLDRVCRKDGVEAGVGTHRVPFIAAAVLQGARAAAGTAIIGMVT